jgi:predicted ArsR family transcriptional regulator
MSNKQRVLEVLRAGEQLSARQIANRFGVANPTALISDLRMSGYAIYLNEGSKDERGRVRASKYRLGNPSRQVIAAGYRALAQGIV